MVPTGERVLGIRRELSPKHCYRVAKGESLTPQQVQHAYSEFVNLKL